MLLVNFMAHAYNMSHRRGITVGDPYLQPIDGLSPLARPDTAARDAFAALKKACHVSVIAYDVAIIAQ